MDIALSRQQALRRQLAVAVRGPHESRPGGTV